MSAPMHGRSSKRRAFRSPHIDGKGTGYSLDHVKHVVRVKRIGFGARENWGEGNWTARDLR